MNTTPLVSIIIPVYNGANYVAEAIESALNQTYRNVEIIVVNDGSRDDGATDEVVSRYADRIRYIRKENGGVATALNLGISEMRGEYFSWLSHDDLYLPNKLEAQIDFLARQGFPDVVVYANHYNLIVSTKVSILTRHAACEDGQFRAREIVANNQVHGCSLLVPRKAFEVAGLFDPKLRVAQDYDLWFRIAQAFPFRYLDEAVATCRVHDKQVGVRMRDWVLTENDEFRLNCLRQLDQAEIEAVGGGSQASGLLYLARRMVRMGCPKSHDYLVRRLRSMFRTGPRTAGSMAAAARAVALDAAYVGAVKLARAARRVLQHKPAA